MPTDLFTVAQIYEFLEEQKWRESYDFSASNSLFVCIFVLPKKTNYMSFVIQQEQLEKLEQSGILSFKEVKEILYAFQIASGQGFAIGKTKAILEYLKKGNVLTIENFNDSGNEKKIKSKQELAALFKSMDEYVDLTTDKDFKEYF